MSDAAGGAEFPSGSLWSGGLDREVAANDDAGGAEESETSSQREGNGASFRGAMVVTGKLRITMIRTRTPYPVARKFTEKRNRTVTNWGTNRCENDCDSNGIHTAAHDAVAYSSNCDCY